LDELLPEIPTFCYLLKKYEENTFISLQLLQISDLLDLKDEGGRRGVREISRELMLSPALAEDVVPLLMRLLSRIEKEEERFILLILEIIADVKEPLDLFCSPEAEKVFSEQVRVENIIYLE
jgi:hypothetical protein